MKYKNFKWKFAISCLIPVGICFLIIFCLMSFWLVSIRDYKTMLLSFIVLVCMFIPAYLVFLLIGDILYHRTKISITDEGIYQNKRLLKYDNIKEIYFGKMGSIYSFQIDPIEDGIFVSKKILLYFNSLDEICYFIIVHNFTNALNYDYQYYVIANHVKKIIDINGEKLHPDFIKLFNEQRTTCDCCGNKTIFKRVTNDICPVCFWEKDEDLDLRFNPNAISDVNHLSIGEAKKNYKEFGACEKKFIDKVRKPFSYELPDYEK